MRITVIDAVHYNGREYRVLSYYSRFSREVKSNVQGYQLTHEVGADRQGVDTGWVDDPSLLVISNEDKVRTLRVFAREVPFAVILPGESVRLNPYEPSSLTVCADGDGPPARVTVTAFPK